MNVLACVGSLSIVVVNQLIAIHLLKWVLKRLFQKLLLNLCVEKFVSGDTRLVFGETCDVSADCICDQGFGFRECFAVGDAAGERSGVNRKLGFLGGHFSAMAEKCPPC